MMIECSELAQKETKHDWVGKVIHWEVCKKLTYTKWYMEKPESILKYVKLWEFEIQTNRLITAKRPDQVLITWKNNLPFSGFCLSGGPQNEN